MVDNLADDMDSQFSLGGWGIARTPTFDSYYALQEKLQSGSYGTVFVGLHKIRKKEYAIKVVDRSNLSARADEALLQEVDIMRTLNPNSFEKSRQNLDDASAQESHIIHVIDFYTSPTKYHIVMELARGGDVFDQLAKRRAYTEKDARDFARKMMLGIEFLHLRGIAHRDIKPENLLLMDYECGGSRLKIADFGFARRFDKDDPDESMKTKCGTPAFVPPELVLGRKYGPKCDVWSAGCTLFMLLSGRPPFSFQKNNKNEMYRSIRAGDFVFYEDYWGHISMKAKKLVLSMLVVDPKSRLSAREVLNDEWMQAKDELLMNQRLDKSLVQIISFNARRKLKGAMSAVMFATKGAFWDIETTAIWRENMHTASATGTELNSINSFSLFNQLYSLDSKMREGVYATMWQGTSTETGTTYAIKVVKRENLNPLEDAAVLNEVSILKSLRHGHIIPLLDFIETPECFYLVMEKCNGGDVLDKVASIAQYSEKDACQLSKGLLDAVQYMHDRGIAHRDLKPQNLLLRSDADSSSVKICDFGYAKRVHMPQSLTTLCGSLHYVAPELLKHHPYDQSADLWSVGVIIFFLLVGYLPFHHKDQHELFKIIRLGKFSFAKKFWTGISEEATTLISHLLDVDPTSRYTATEALQSKWFERVKEPGLETTNLGDSLIKISKLSNSLKGTVRAIQWVNRDRRMSSVTVDNFDPDVMLVDDES